MKKAIIITALIFLISCEKQEEEILKTSGQYYTTDFCEFEKTITLEEIENNVIVVDGIMRFNMVDGYGKVNQGVNVFELEILTKTKVRYTQTATISNMVVVCENEFNKL